MEALNVTPQDIEWYLSIFPGREELIDEFKNNGKIIVKEGVKNVRNY